MRSVFRSLPAEDQTWEELMSRYIQKEDEKDRQEQADKSAVQGQAAALHLKRGSGGNGGKGGAGGKKDGQDKGKKGDWKAIGGNRRHPRVSQYRTIVTTIPASN